MAKTGSMKSGEYRFHKDWMKEKRAGCQLSFYDWKKENNLLDEERMTISITMR